MTRCHVSISILFSACISLLIYAIPHFASEYNVLDRLNDIPQNGQAFVPHAQEIMLKPQTQQRFVNYYLEQFFLPWHEAVSPEKLGMLKQDLITRINRFEQTPGYGPNTHRYSSQWIKQLAANLNLNAYTNQQQTGITLRDSYIRSLPTTEPAFIDLKASSKGYPFDQLQETFISSGTPLRIVHHSHNGEWDLIVTSSFSGWIPAQDIAMVTPRFEQEWQTGTYAVSCQDNIPLYDSHQNMVVKTRIGVIYPVSQRSATSWQIITPAVLPDGKVVIKPLTVDKKLLNAFPVPFSQSEVAEIINNLLGKPYGWGGVYGYRDCSATTRDLMATFGIWLPRNSDGQAQAGVYHSLANLNNKQKEQWIIKNAIPFVTLLHMPGHVVLYIGQQNGHPIVFQDIWGVHIYKFFNNNDRVVIGKTVITPLNFAGYFFNTSLNQLTVTDSAITLIPANLFN